LKNRIAYLKIFRRRIGCQRRQRIGMWLVVEFPFCVFLYTHPSLLYTNDKSSWKWRHRIFQEPNSFFIYFRDRFNGLSRCVCHVARLYLKPDRTSPPFWIEFLWRPLGGVLDYYQPTTLKEKSIKTGPVQMILLMSCVMCFLKFIPNRSSRFGLFTFSPLLGVSLDICSRHPPSRYVSD
jgi:hypothetical protein